MEEGPNLGGAKMHMSDNQEAYDAECAALSHTLELAAQRKSTPERVTIFSDAQAAIRRMGSDEPGRGQQYAILGQKQIATLRRARAGITTEIRWCPAHKGITGNEKPTSGPRQRQGSQAAVGLSHDPSLISRGKS